MILRGALGRNPWRTRNQVLVNGAAEHTVSMWYGAVLSYSPNASNAKCTSVDTCAIRSHRPTLQCEGSARPKARGQALRTAPKCKQRSGLSHLVLHNRRRLAARPVRVLAGCFVPLSALSGWCALEPAQKSGNRVVSS
jgi:hypothetical protein